MSKFEELKNELGRLDRVLITDDDGNVTMTVGSLSLTQMAEMISDSKIRDQLKGALKLSRDDKMPLPNEVWLFDEEIDALTAGEARRRLMQLYEWLERALEHVLEQAGVVGEA